MRMTENNLKSSTNDVVIILADRRIKIYSLYPQTIDFLKPYAEKQTGLSEDSGVLRMPDFEVAISSNDISFEQEKSSAEDRYEGRPIRKWNESYLETLAIYRKIAEKMPMYDTILFHGSVIAVDGEGYLFTAASGTGKSTHTRLWCRLLGDKAQIINDDKPLIRINNDGAVIYGTPWDGKHHLSTNTNVPLKAVCILKRGEENTIRQINPIEQYPMLLQQMYRPADENALLISLNLLDRLMHQIKFYELHCNMDIAAAQTAYRAMKE